MYNSTDFTVVVTMETEDEKEYFPLKALIPIGISVIFLISVAVFGNILTICSFIRDKHLRNVYNTYLLNLAVTDLLIAVFSMLFYAIYTLNSDVWVLGDAFCKVYLVIDFTLCTESVLMICLISYDRLLLLKRGPYYTKQQTKKVAYVKISLSWIIAFLLYSPAVIGWDIWTGEDIVADDDCDVQFAHNLAFTAATAVCEFVIPLIALIVINSLIFHEIKKRIKSSSKQLPKDAMSSKTIYVNVVQPPASVSLQDSGDSSTKDKQTPSASSSCNTLNRLEDGAIKMANKHRIKTKRYIKATKFLAALVAVFMVTWTPYTISTIIIAFCKSCVNVEAYEVMTWLLWSKASIDPFLYALNSKRFQRNFLQILTCGYASECRKVLFKRNRSTSKSSTYTDHT